MFKSKWKLVFRNVTSLQPAGGGVIRIRGSDTPINFLYDTHGKAGLLFTRPTGDISKHSLGSDVFLTNSSLPLPHTSAPSTLSIPFPYPHLQFSSTVPHIR